MNPLVPLAAVLAVAVAVRSTWSPCGLSMLSTITPLAERSRGHRFAATAAWFVAGSILGGLTLGAGMALLATAVAAVGLSASAALLVAAAVLLVAATSDARLFGWQLPFHIRQVNEDWLSQFRVGIYAGGFGWQIGSGLATYIMTAGVYALIVLGALTMSPATALALGALFGLVRGLALFAGAGVHDPQQLMAMHRRFERWREPVRRALIAIEAVAATVAAYAALGPAIGVALIAVPAAAIAVHVLVARPADEGPTVDQPVADREPVPASGVAASSR